MVVGDGGWFKGAIFSREFYAVGIPSACVSVACLHLSLYFLLSLPLTFPRLLPGKKAIFFFFFFPRVCWNIKLPHNLLPHTNALQFQLKHLLLFSHSVVSNSLQPHGLQHTRLPCPSLSPEFAQTHVHWVNDAIQPFHPLCLSKFIINMDIAPALGMGNVSSSNHKRNEDDIWRQALKRTFA